LPESEVAGTYAARGVGRRFPRGLSFAVAATVLLAAAAAVWVGRFASESLRKKEIVEVEVLSAEQAELEGHERAVHNGERMQLSRLALKRGSLRLRLPSGVVLDLLGPVDGVFDGPARFHLARGGLNADVGERGKGFAVVTKAGEILDLGTRFGVNVSQAGEADIAVFSGEVRVHDCGIRSSNAFVTVSEGEALRLHVGRHADRLSTVPLRREETAMDTASESLTLADVTDNVKEADFRRFYGIVAGGMAEGTLAYTDKPNVAWRPLQGYAFPSELLGADAVRTFHTDRHDLDLKITLHFRQPSVVYVMHDARTPALDWLEEGFEDTGWRIRSGPWKPMPVVRDVAADASGEICVEYTVWRTEAPAGGSIELGSPHVCGEGGAKVMFGLAVKPLAANVREDGKS